MTFTAPTSRLLALETSTEHCSVAVSIGDDVICNGRHAGQNHSAILLPMVDELLRQAGLGVADLNAIAFGAGPGSFTGLRIACGVAQGLAFAVDCPCVPVGSLQALAEASAGDRVAVCTDARMGQVYHAAFERGEGDDWNEVLPPALCNPDAMPDLPGAGWLGCGDGFERYPQIMAGAYGSKLAEIRQGLIPHAREIAVLGVRYLLAGRSVASVDVAPVYVRNKVALTMKERQ